MSTLEERVAFIEGQVSEQSHAMIEVREAVRMLEHRVDGRFEAKDRRRGPDRCPCRSRSRLRRLFERPGPRRRVGGRERTRHRHRGGRRLRRQRRQRFRLDNWFAPGAATGAGAVAATSARRGGFGEALPPPPPPPPGPASANHTSGGNSRNAPVRSTSAGASARRATAQARAARRGRRPMRKRAAYLLLWHVEEQLRDHARRQQSTPPARE